MPDYRNGRESLVEALRGELVGPAPVGAPIDCVGPVRFEKKTDAYHPFVQADTGEEIVQRDTPLRRYGAGILYPYGTFHEPGMWQDAVTAEEEAPPSALDADAALDEREQEMEELVDDQERERLVEAQDSLTGGEPSDAEDFDLSGANLLRPSTMAVTFMARFPEGSRLKVEATGGRYRRKKISIEKDEWAWWLRAPVRVTASIDASQLLDGGERLLDTDQVEADGTENLDIRVEVFTRPRGERTSLITVCLVNRTPTMREVEDERCLFQARFDAMVEAPGEAPSILPYPEAAIEHLDDEERSIALLYRNAQTFAIGHGCAADWSFQYGQEAVREVSADPLPVVETPSITPDVEVDGEPFTASMAALAGLIDGEDGFDELERLATLYENWIEQRRKEAATLDERHLAAGKRHIDEALGTLRRIREGIDLLRRDKQCLRAFRLANHAMLLQQIRSQREPRRASFDTEALRFRFSAEAPSADLLDPPSGRGSWRPFQIAFILLSLPSVSEGEHPDRELVELIWFPTGGGKTEAYLGLAAYAMFLRRLRRSDDAGVDVLMRYTLRLLTAQQFQRASALVCAMESLRREAPVELGPTPITIGIWLGRKTTPNTRADAKSSLRQLMRGDRYAENRFILLKCPWCSAEMGPLRKRAPSKHAPKLLGYEERGDTVVLRCADPRCEFADRLPVYVIDEDIYEARPSLVIGTVDKFAMLAWRSDARSIFGIGEEGDQEVSPPGLIIQDELHLISGPLGSLVGLYESVIEELCARRLNGVIKRPKIVSSTATIRRYEEQVRALYARNRVSLFPPRGLEAGDSFFARYARNNDGSLAPGRTYVGVHATNLPSMATTEVRVFSALVQAAALLPEDERDPWWSLVAFFNSLRELGTALTLFQSDIPDYLTVIRNRLGLEKNEIRRLRHVLELTGRLRSDEVPRAMASLEVTSSSGDYPVDACLASAIMEVGIDIDRLSLMAILSQPKTTSTYIQVTGRIGRLWWERPGLVVTMLSPSRPRDRSHFEKFRSYHDRLYAQVEPTSVTPFSPPALDRALHALLALFVRQRGGEGPTRSPHPFPADLIDEIHDVLLERVKVVDPDEVENLEEVFANRVAEWKRWERVLWDGAWNQQDQPLLTPAGQYVSPARARVTWATPTSLRTVDVECQAEVTRHYLHDDSQEAETDA